MICHVCGYDDSIIIKGEDSHHLNGTCKSCSQPFCKDHASEFDLSLCTVCVSKANTKIEKLPLKDENGVTHHGVKIVLTGEAWMRSRDVIANMTDVELQAKLQSLKLAVHEAELMLDYRRIMMHQAQNEQDTRASKKSARLRLITGIDALHKSANTINVKPSEKVDAAKDALKSLKGMGLNQTAIANLLTILAKKKDAK